MKEAIDTYIKSVKALCPKMTKEDLEYLERGLTVTELSTKHFYIQANTVQHQIGYVFKGLLRAFYIDQNGNDVTIRFVKEGQFATDYTSFIMQKPGKYYFQCLEPSVLVNLHYNHIQNGYARHSGIESYGRLIAEEVLKNQQKRIESFLFENAEQRYLNFIKEDADLFNRVSLSYLSSYLGIERPSLSRIRKKLAQQ